MAYLVRTILVAVDFSETSDHALEVGLDLAQAFGASVHVVHVYQIPVYGFPDGAFLAGPEVATRLAQASQRGLDEIVARHASRGVAMVSHLKEGPAHEGILDTGEEISADLLIVGTHGRGAIAHALLGSVSEKIVRTSKIPVLTVRKP
jgi:nucleotide-binding universal stress UspA family protein